MARDKWRPIKTVPKGTCRIIAYDPAFGNVMIATLPHKEWRSGGYVIYPTLWMPLPKLPKGAR